MRACVRACVHACVAAGLRRSEDKHPEDGAGAVHELLPHFSVRAQLRHGEHAVSFHFRSIDGALYICTHKVRDFQKI
jgi:hypothetical protein